jgi:hypothetical protein
MGGEIKFAGTVAALLIAGYAIYHAVASNADAIVQFITIAIIAIGLIAFAMYLKFKHEEYSLYKGMPEGAPMKVDLRVQQIRSRRHRLHINVKMCRSDFLATKKAGLYSFTLCSYEPATAAGNNYVIGHLGRIHHIDFDNMQDLQHSKDEFIESMHALRTRIDSQKEFQHTPEARSESFEV